MLEPVAVGNLLKLAKALAKASGRTLSAISRSAHGDGRCLDQLAKGTGSITLRKHDEAMLYLQDPMNWPNGAKIPTVDEPWRRAARTRGDERG